MKDISAPSSSLSFAPRFGPSLLCPTTLCLHEVHGQAGQDWAHREAQGVHGGTGQRPIDLRDWLKRPTKEASKGVPNQNLSILLLEKLHMRCLLHLISDQRHSKTWLITRDAHHQGCSNITPLQHFCCCVQHVPVCRVGFASRRLTLRPFLFGRRAAAPAVDAPPRGRLTKQKHMICNDLVAESFKEKTINEQFIPKTTRWRAVVDSPKLTSVDRLVCFNQCVDRVGMQAPILFGIPAQKVT